MNKKRLLSPISACFSILLCVLILMFVLWTHAGYRYIYLPNTRMQSWSHFTQEGVRADIATSNDLVETLVRELDDQSVFYDGFWSMTYFETREAFRYNTNKDAHYLFSENTLQNSQRQLSSQGNENWLKFLENMNDRYLYDWSDLHIDELLNDMSTLETMSVAEQDEGTKMKFIFSFSLDFKGIARPMRSSREEEEDPNHLVRDDMERHNAEIAAFHLDRLLGFCRVPPSSGRRVNITQFKALLPLYVQRTFFTSAVGNTCLTGTCTMFCEGPFAVCAQADGILEFSVMAYLPHISPKVKIAALRNPYYLRQTRQVAKLAGETNKTYCNGVKQQYPFNQSDVLLNLIDIHVFDFLIGNRDRHNLYYYEGHLENQHFILFDNGQGFGVSGIDFTSRLAPLEQCCQIRESTLLKLIKLYKGPDKLSALMEKSLEADPLTPILASNHLAALDRRLEKVLETVARCIEHKPVNTVLHKDKGTGS